MQICHTINTKTGYECVPMKAEDADKIILTAAGRAPGAKTFSDCVAGPVIDQAVESLCSEPNPHKHLIETICNDVLPNRVRLYEANIMGNALSRDQFEKLIEQKVERAKKSLNVLPGEDQQIYRVKIDRAYAENVDRLRGIPERKNPVFDAKWHRYHPNNSFL
jgi:hypothetical protein